MFLSPSSPRTTKVTRKPKESTKKHWCGLSETTTSNGTLCNGGPIVPCTFLLGYLRAIIHVEWSSRDSAGGALLSHSQSSRARNPCYTDH